MAKYGVRLKIDVTKIIKDRMFKGEKGTYLDATVFIDVDKQDKYDNNGMITQSWKDQEKGEGPILGNAKVFWRDVQQAHPAATPVSGSTDFDDDIPF